MPSLVMLSPSQLEEQQGWLQVQYRMEWSHGIFIGRSDGMFDGVFDRLFDGLDDGLYNARVDGAAVGWYAGWSVR